MRRKGKTALESRFAVRMIALVLLATGAGSVAAQNYPHKTLRIVTSEVGSSTDSAARIVASGLAGLLSQPVIVENRGGNVSGDIVARGTPDGHTLLAVGSSFWTGSLLRKTSYDPVQDFSPISLMTSSPSALVVHPSVPIKSVRELIALAKAKPGEINCASGAIGGAPQLAAALFKSMAGVNIVFVPYKGAGLALTAVIGGEVQMTFVSVGTVGSHVKSGRLRAVAVGSLEPSALAPGLPTVSASGLPGFEAGTKSGLLAPAHTPVAIIALLNRETVQVLNRAEVKEKLFNAGIEVAGTTPAQFAAGMQSEMVRMGKMIKDAGIRVED